MKTLLIIYHTQTGGTAQMARAAAQGALAEPGVTVKLLHASEAGPAEVLAADGFLFASPEYLGSLSGLVKDFFDRTYYPALERVNGRPCAFMVCAGNDGTGAVRQLERITTGWRLRRVAEPLIVRTHATTEADILANKTVTDEDLDLCRELGAALAAGLALGIF